jgi:F-type H+-transporting ATPase subunit b
MLSQAVAFAIFIWFTVKFVWPPLMKAIEQRQEADCRGLAQPNAANGISHWPPSAQPRIAARGYRQRNHSQAEKRGAAVVEEAKTAAKPEAERIVTGAKPRSSRKFFAPRKRCVPRCRARMTGAEDSQARNRCELTRNCCRAWKPSSDKPMANSPQPLPYAEAIFRLAKQVMRTGWSDALNLIASVYQDHRCRLRSQPQVSQPGYRKAVAGHLRSASMAWRATNPVAGAQPQAAGAVEIREMFEQLKLEDEGKLDAARLFHGRRAAWPHRGLLSLAIQAQD